MPRLKPPFPANVGLYGCPTTVNNVETIAQVPDILRRGAAWFAGIGRPNNTGTKLFCISGHVEQPCNVEEAMGIPLRELIERHAGGVRGGWDNLLAVIPGGSSMPLVPAGPDQCDTLLMDFDGCRDKKSGARHRRRDRDGQVRPTSSARWRASPISTSTRAAASARPAARAWAGCGACSRAWPRAARRSARSTCCCEVTKQIEGHTICAFGDGAAWPVQGLMRHFRPEIERRIDEYTRNAACRSRMRRARRCEAASARVWLSRSRADRRASATRRS